MRLGFEFPLRTSAKQMPKPKHKTKKETDKPGKHLNISCHLRIEYRFCLFSSHYYLYLFTSSLFRFLVKAFGHLIFIYSAMFIYLFACLSVGVFVIVFSTCDVGLKDHKT